MQITRRQTLLLALPTPLLTQEARIRADFAAGRVVVVNGWLLSRTEAEEAPQWTP